MFGKIVAGIIGGFIVACIAINIVNLAFYSNEANAVVFLVSWMVAIVIALKSSRSARAWRCFLFISAALLFTTPLATFIRTTKETEGIAIVGGLFATGIFSIIFPLLGIAFLIIGLLVGRDKEVVVIKEGQPGGSP